MVYYHRETSDLRESNQSLNENLIELNAEYSQLKNDFKDLKNSYKEKSETLAETKQDLKENKEKLRSLKLSFQENLEHKESKIDNIRQKLSRKTTDIEELQKEVEKLQERNKKLESKISSWKSSYQALEENHQFVVNELENLRSGDRYNMHDPTYWEAKKFVQNDNTDKNEYHENKYTCYDYTKDFINNAMEQGILAGFVRLETEEETGPYTIIIGDNKGAHALVAFRTTDEGIVYVEPQNDVILKNLNVGEAYWDEIEKASNIDYTEYPKYWIQDIDIIW